MYKIAQMQVLSNILHMQQKGSFFWCPVTLFSASLQSESESETVKGWGDQTQNQVTNFG